MFRWALSLLLVVALASSATASLHKFTLNSVDNPGFSVIKSDFELADTSPPSFPGYYYANSSNTMSIQLAVVMDPIEKIKYIKDSTLAMLWAASDRGSHAVPGALIRPSPFLDGARQAARS